MLLSAFERISEFISSFEKRRKVFLYGKIATKRWRRVGREIVFATQPMVSLESHVSLNFVRAFFRFIVNRFTAVGQKCLGPPYRFDKVLPSSDVWTSDYVAGRIMKISLNDHVQKKSFALNSLTIPRILFFCSSSATQPWQWRWQKIKKQRQK